MASSSTLRGNKRPGDSDLTSNRAGFDPNPTASGPSSSAHYDVMASASDDEPDDNMSDEQDFEDPMFREAEYHKDAPVTEVR
jgi:hypothetical protein